MAELLGFRLGGIIPALILPLLLTASLFLGPLFESTVIYRAKVSADYRVHGKARIMFNAFVHLDPYLYPWQCVRAFIAVRLNPPTCVRCTTTTSSVF